LVIAGDPDKPREGLCQSICKLIWKTWIVRNDHREFARHHANRTQGMSAALTFRPPNSRTAILETSQGAQLPLFHFLILSRLRRASVIHIRVRHIAGAGAIMAKDRTENEPAVQQQRRALSSWDNEGGALAPIANHPPLDKLPELTNAELVQLRIRVIALENLVMALLAEGSDKQINAAREMATYISPRPGFTQHPLTVQAAKHMNDITERAFSFRNASSL
jgi:hypothetical protein